MSTFSTEATPQIQEGGFIEALWLTEPSTVDIYLSGALLLPQVEIDKEIYEGVRLFKEYPGAGTDFVTRGGDRLNRLVSGQSTTFAAVNRRDSFRPTPDTIPQLLSVNVERGGQLEVRNYTTNCVVEAQEILRGWIQSRQKIEPQRHGQPDLDEYVGYHCD